MRRMSKQTKWFKVSQLFLDLNGMTGEGIEGVCVTRWDVAKRLGCTKKTAARILDEFARDGLIEVDFIPQHGNFGIYEYYLSDSIIANIQRGEL